MDTAMDTVIYKHSILNKDGHNIIVDLYAWATGTLSGATLSRFLSDWSEYMVYLDEKILQNIIKFEEIFEEVTVGGVPTQISIGYKITVPRTGYEDHPTFTYWSQQMQLDPNIVEFNLPETKFT